MAEQIYDLQILPPAQAELEEIAHVHLNLSGVQSARKITNKIYHAMEQLTFFPQMGVAVQDELLKPMGYRYTLAGKYLVFYRVVANAVVVYHIVHGATDYPKMYQQFS